MKLTEHFSLAEFQHSATASRLGIDNTVPSTLIPNLSTLCRNVLEPLRKHVGEAVIISSGYRCPVLNKAVGGVGNSQHMKGEAADVVCSDRQKLHSWFRWIADNTNFDQLIYERSGTRTWIHVSCKPDITVSIQ